MDVVETRFVAIGDGPEEAAAASVLGWPCIRIAPLHGEVREQGQDCGMWTVLRSGLRLMHAYRAGAAASSCCSPTL